MKRSPPPLVLVVLLVVLVVVGVEGKTWYIQDNSSNPASGVGSKEDPFGSFGVAMNVVLSGDILLAFSGNYQGPMNTGLQLFPNQTHLYFDVVEENNVIIDLSNTKSIPFFSFLSENESIYTNNYSISFNMYTFTGQTSGNIFESDLNVEMTFNSCTFSNNPLEQGSIINIENTILKMSGCDIKDNNNNMEKINENSVIFSKKSTIYMENTTIFGNGVFGESVGGGLYGEESEIHLESVIFENNVAKNGGGMYIIDSVLYFNDVHFINNTATMFGGGLYIDTKGQNFTFKKDKNHNNNNNHNDNHIIILFYENVANQNGGGFYVNNSETEKKGNIKISDIHFIKNIASYEGGGLMISDTSGNITIQDCFFENNLLSSPGSANGAQIYIYKSSLVVVDNNEFIWNNTFSHNQGVIIYCYSTKVVFFYDTNNINWKGEGNGVPYHFYDSEVHFYASAFNIYMDHSQFYYCRESNATQENYYWNLQDSKTYLINDLEIEDSLAMGGDFVTSTISPLSNNSICPNIKRKNGENNIQIKTTNLIAVGWVILQNFDLEIPGSFEIENTQTSANLQLSGCSLALPNTSSVTLEESSSLYLNNYNAYLAIGGSLTLNRDSKITANVEFLDNSMVIFSGHINKQENQLSTITGNVFIGKNVTVETQVLYFDRGKKGNALKWASHGGEFINYQKQYRYKYSKHNLEVFYGVSDTLYIGITFGIIIVILAILGGLYLAYYMKNRAQNQQYGEIY